MLVVWDSDTLPDIAEDLGVNDVPDWPSKRHVPFCYIVFSQWD